MPADTLRDAIRGVISAGCGCNRGRCQETGDCGCLDDADAILALVAPIIEQARADAIEEAAQEAEEFARVSHTFGAVPVDPFEATAAAARGVAVSIRVLAHAKPAADRFARPADVSTDGANLCTTGGG